MDVFFQKTSLCQAMKSEPHEIRQTTGIRMEEANDFINIANISGNEIYIEDEKEHIIKKNPDIDTLIEIKFKELSDLMILEYQTHILNYLRKNIKNKNIENIDINDIVLKIDWLLCTSSYLSDKLGLIIFQHK